MPTTTAPISTEEARFIAGNPDGCNADELRGLINYIGEGDCPDPQSAAIWPDWPNWPSPHAYERAQAAVTLRGYCNLRLRAMARRLRGEINLAICDERESEYRYAALPAFLQW
jgi:hypothetical protein